MVMQSIFFAAANGGGWFDGAVIGGVVGLGIGVVYKLCFGGPGRQP